MSSERCAGENYAAAFLEIIPAYLMDLTGSDPLTDDERGVISNTLKEGNVLVEAKDQTGYKASFDCDRCAGRVVMEVETGGMAEVQRPPECPNKGTISATPAEEFRYERPNPRQQG